MHTKRDTRKKRKRVVRTKRNVDEKEMKLKSAGAEAPAEFLEQKFSDGKKLAKP